MQQQQQSRLGTMKPSPAGRLPKSIPIKSRIKKIGEGLKKAKKKVISKPTFSKVQSSIRKTMGY